MNNVKSSFKLHDETIKYRHTDPPWLWIAVFTGSIFLHLFVFWFLHLYDQFLPWIPRSNQDYIAIDLIDIPFAVESQPTTVKPQVSSSSQRSVTASLPKTTLITPENPDDQVINSDLHLSQQEESKNTKVNNQALEPKPTSTSTSTPTFTPQSQFTPKPTPKPTPTSTFTPQSQFTPKPTPTQTIPFNNLPWNRRQEIKLGKGTLLPNDVPSESPTPTPESETTPTSTPESETTSTPKAGGLLANIAPILKDEVEQLRQSGQLRIDGLPDVLAEYQGLPSKELELNFLASDSGLKSANILASLVIDKNGNFQQAVIISIEPATIRSEKSIYEQALNEMFQQEIFVAAYNQDGSKPDLSNLYVRIRIESINFQ